MKTKTKQVKTKQKLRKSSRDSAQWQKLNKQKQTPPENRWDFPRKAVFSEDFTAGDTLDF